MARVIAVILGGIMRRFGLALCCVISLGREAGGQSSALAQIETRKVAQMGNDDGPGSFATIPSTLVRMSDGRLVVVELNGFPAVFDGRGKFLKRLGRRGE